MNIIIGQEQLCTSIKRLTLNNFPHSILLVGSRGSGKDLIIEFISEHLNLPVEVLEDVSVDSLTDIQLRTETKIYVLDDMTIKTQNQILKFLEEPPCNSFVIVKARKLNQYLTTIENRCRIWQLDIYSKDTLKLFNTTQNEAIIDIAQTPGDVINLCNSNFEEVSTLASKILEKISIASYGNLFNIIDTLNSDKLNIDIELFVRVLMYYSKMKELESKDTMWFDIYLMTSKVLSDFQINHIDRIQVFENYLMKLKEYYANR